MVNLILEGVRQNNLKDIDLELPLGKAIVFTGPSGSGKSSLAFETIYAEGQRRYMQSLSTYARQFLEKFRAPEVERIANIPPTIALEQFNPVRNSRATVGTSTEVYDYLRLLFEKLGVEYCAACNRPMERKSLPQIFLEIAGKHPGENVLVAFSKLLPTDSDSAEALLKEYLRNGFSRILWKKEVVAVEEVLKGKIPVGKEVSVLLDRIKMPEKKESETVQTRMTEAIRTAMEMGGGLAQIIAGEQIEEVTTQNRCPKCHTLAQPKGASVFSFNSPLGACQTCKGFGNTLEVDEELVIPNPSLSIARGAIDPFMKPSLRQWQKKLLEYCKAQRIDADLPYRELPAEHKKLIFDGEKKKFKGVRGVFRMLEEEKYKLRIRVFVSRYTSPFTCPTCRGTRLNSSALQVRVGGKNIAEVCALTLGESQEFIQKLPLSNREKEIAADVLRQIERRLSYLNIVGLNYLTLSRLSRTLSGGEYQRTLLATQLSQGLTDTLYVLDEPSIGLHPKDTQQLLKVLNQLRSQGNSLFLVEHDPEVIEWGEHIVDMGPGSGSRGGQVVFSGSRERFAISDCATAQAVRSWKDECRRLQSKSQPVRDQWLEIKGAAGNNLKGINVEIPLKSLVAVTGVSGSGKSTLVVDTLYNALAKIFHGKSDRIARFGSMSGFEFLSGVELVDQSPIGKSSRSNPITFIKGYDEIRSLFAQTREAVGKRLTPGHFSFNVAGGRCEECEGEGRVSVDMVFMEDVWIPCQVCDEKRFKPSVLAVRVRGKNIDDVLRMTVEEAFTFFQGTPSLRSKLALLAEVGLGYLQLGQPGYTLSGGEAQRLKIARELAGATARRPATLFILDEPTTGLHFNEITRLIHVLRRLIGGGHSVIVIEHNLQMICAADYLIDLGPDGGDQGGRVIATGTPQELADKALPHTGKHLASILGRG